MADIGSFVNLAPTILEAARIAILGIDSKVKAAKSNSDKDKAISGLEMIINELLENQNALIRNQQVLEAELNTKLISDSDLDYISQKLLPVVEELLLSNATSHEARNQVNSQIEKIKPIISMELLKVLQIIGFNIKEAVGSPTTELVRQLIQGGIKRSEDQNALSKLNMEFQSKVLDICTDKESFERYQKLTKNSL